MVELPLADGVRKAPGKAGGKAPLLMRPAGHSGGCFFKPFKSDYFFILLRIWSLYSLIVSLLPYKSLLISVSVLLPVKILSCKYRPSEVKNN